MTLARGGSKQSWGVETGMPMPCATSCRNMRWMAVIRHHANAVALK